MEDVAKAPASWVVAMEPANQVGSCTLSLYLCTDITTGLSGQRGFGLGGLLGGGRGEGEDRGWIPPHWYTPHGKIPEIDI